MTMWLRLGLVIAAAAAFFVAIYTIQELGAVNERGRTNEKNHKAGSQAELFHNSLRDCLADGRVFNFRTGKCAGTNSSKWKFPSWSDGKDSAGSRQD